MAILKLLVRTIVLQAFAAMQALYYPTRYHATSIPLQPCRRTAGVKFVPHNTPAL